MEISERAEKKFSLLAGVIHWCKANRFVGWLASDFGEGHCEREQKKNYYCVISSLNERAHACEVVKTLDGDAKCSRQKV